MATCGATKGNGKFGLGYIYCDNEGYFGQYEFTPVGAPAFAQQFNVFVNGIVVNQFVISAVYTVAHLICLQIAKISFKILYFMSQPNFILLHVESKASRRTQFLSLMDSQ